MNIHANKQEGVLIRCSLSLPLHSRQVDQLRSELMQERSARHDLEMDKSALERQVLFTHQVNAGAHKFTNAVITGFIHFAVHFGPS